MVALVAISKHTDGKKLFLNQHTDRDPNYYLAARVDDLTFDFCHWLLQLDLPFNCSLLQIALRMARFLEKESPPRIPNLRHLGDS